MYESEKAAVKKALAMCAKSGLQGGVFEGSFCAWPSDAQHPMEGPEDFFENIEAAGGFVLDSTHNMNLDGGAGN